MSAAPVVEVSGLRVELAGTGHDVVDEIAVTVRPGEVLGLVGESGSGKTTVGMALLGHVRRGGRVAVGEVSIDGRALGSLPAAELRRLRGGVVAYIPQDPGSALNPALRIGEQLAEVLAAHGGAAAAERRERIREVLEEVGLPADPAFLRRYPHQLSGGQQQRVTIAMAFAVRPRVIVCDEPTTGLDVTTQARVLATLRELCRRHAVAALYVTHDLAVVAELADRVAVLYAGRIVECGPRDAVFGAPRHPYTRRLLGAVPDIAGRRAIVGIPGYAALPGHRPAGCFFHPRCDAAGEECRRAFPPAVRVGEDHELRCHHPVDGEPDVAVRVARVRATPASDDRAVLDVVALEASYGAQVALHGVDLRIGRNECVAVVGESGSGKTTLARCVAGLHRQWTGEVRFGERALAPAARQRSREDRQRIQYVFQNPYASLNPRRTVGQAIGRQLQLFFPGARRETARRVAACLDSVALSPGAADRFPDELSGGERQRVAIARALAAEPWLLICDEVTSALDVSVQAAIVELLEDLRERVGLSLLFVTHELALIRTIADRVAVMTAGRIVEEGPVDDVLGRPAAAYTRELLANTPSVDAVGKPPPGW